MARYFSVLSLSSVDDALCAVAEITAAAPLAEWTVCCRSRYASHDHKVYEITARWRGAELTRTGSLWTARLLRPVAHQARIDQWLRDTPSLSVFHNDQEQIFSMMAPSYEALDTLVDILSCVSFKNGTEQHAEQQQP